MFAGIAADELTYNLDFGSPQTERDEFAESLLEQVDAIRQIGRKRLRDRGALDDFTQETLARAFQAHSTNPSGQRMSKRKG